ncbi:PEP-utilizing enzyme [Rhodococcus koreensis]|uniref:PEP-utilizing enzyme n=1 Tax=Rhodococcus koreensis TaxID=99653 RepID=UPI00366BD9E1
MSPMCWSIWGESAEWSWLYSMYAFGVIPKKALVVSPDMNDRGLSCFYGRQAFNVDAIKETMSSLPGVSPDDFERDLMGSVRPDAKKVESSNRRLPFVLVKAPGTAMRTGRRIRKLHDRMYAKWLKVVYERDPAAQDRPAIERLLEARQDFVDVFSVHCVVRFLFQGGQSGLAAAAEKAGDAALAADLLAGVGGVLETTMTDDLWRLGHHDISEDEFLRKWGYHGPNEGNPYATSWREDPTPIRYLAAASAARERPNDRAARAQDAAKDAERRLLAGTAALQRPVIRWLLKRMQNTIRTLQIGKAGYLMALDEARAAVKAFGAEQVQLGQFDEPDDAFFLTIEECQQLAAGELPNARAIVRARRATRIEYKNMEMPLSFVGMPTLTPKSDWSSADILEVTGAASGGGIVEGRARIVVEADDDIDLDPGDILVCRFTDPGWAPLMALADALVIDIGTSASHGAVVARELGIPFVIGTGNGTRAVREGDRILVDGGAGVVKVLERATGQEATSA